MLCSFADANRSNVSLPSASGLMWPSAKSRIAQPAPGSAPRFSARRDVTTPRNTVSSVNATIVAMAKLTTPATMGCGLGPKRRSTSMFVERLSSAKRGFGLFSMNRPTAMTAKPPAAPTTREVGSNCVAESNARPSPFVSQME